VAKCDCRERYYTEMNTVKETNGLKAVEVKNLKKWFPLRQGIIASIVSRKKQKFVKAVDGVSFSLNRGEILGLAGESGCGKTTVGRVLTGLTPPTSGKVIFAGEDLSSFGPQQLRKFHKETQMVFQDPYESLNPRRTVFNTIAEPLRIQRICKDKAQLTERVYKAMLNVKLEPPENYIAKFPHQLSGGERQRVAIARALVLEPSLLVADEPVSMLDVSIRAGILRLLKNLMEKFNMSILYISHDLSTVRYLCHKTAIMYLGKIVEMGETNEIFDNPLHPYTKALMFAVPIPEPGAKKKKLKIGGEPPNPIDLPEGCSFRPRCPYSVGECTHEPTLTRVGEEHYVRCIRYGR